LKKTILLVSLLTGNLLLTPLHASLNSKNENDRLSAAKKAAIKPSYRQIKSLLKIAASDKNKTIRYYAARALGKLKNLRTLYPLRRIFLKEKDPKVNMALCIAIADMPNKSGFRVLEYTTMPGNSMVVRTNTLKVLSSRLGRNITFMLNLLFRDRNFKIRLAAASVLKQSGTDKNFYYMKTILLKEKHTGIKSHVIDGMMAIKKPYFIHTAGLAYLKESNHRLLSKLAFLMVKLNKSKASIIMKKALKISSKPIQLRVQYFKLLKLHYGKKMALQELKDAVKQSKDDAFKKRAATFL